MKDPLEQLHNARGMVRLSSEAKQRIAHHLIAHIETHPVATRLPFWQRVFLPTPAFASLLVVILVGGGTAYGAEKSLPGEPLYAVKVNVNEVIRGALAISPEAKEEWEITRVERRLAEADAIEKKDNVEALESALADRFAMQARKIEERIEKLEADGKDEDALRLANRFEEKIVSYGKREVPPVQAMIVAPAAKSFDAMMTAIEVLEEKPKPVRPVKARVESGLQRVAEVRERIENRRNEKTRIAMPQEEQKTDQKTDAITKPELAGEEPAKDPMASVVSNTSTGIEATSVMLSTPEAEETNTGDDSQTTSSRSR